VRVAPPYFVSGPSHEMCRRAFWIKLVILLYFTRRTHAIRYQYAIVESHHVVDFLVIQKKITISTNSFFGKGKGVRNKVAAKVVGEEVSGSGS
jgi:hypothetical protein